MKQTLISLVAALTLVLTACDKNDDAPGGCIEIIPTIGSQTRVPSLNEDGSGGFTKGDQFTIVTSRGWETARSSDYTVGGDWQTWEQLGYPTGVKINFAACYPPAQPAGDGTFTFDSSTAEYKDLLLANTRTCCWPPHSRWMPSARFPYTWPSGMRCTSWR